MSNTVLIIGQSGSGKSTSLRNLDSKTTFVINVLDKPLPFRGFKKNYTALKPVRNEQGERTGEYSGNYFASDDWDAIIKCIDAINKGRPDITTIVIDDWQYILANEFMNSVSIKGYEKFSLMANHAWATIGACIATRANLTCFILAHSDTDINGRAKCKTIGKLLDDKITIEGMFTTVLHARVLDGQYLFQTQSDNDHLAKSPMGMFAELFIPNDLAIVKNAIETYFNDEEVAA